MGIFSLFRKKPAPEPEKENRGIPITQSDLGISVFGRMSEAGPAVNPDTALQLSTVYRAVRILSESIASLPLHVKEVQPDGSKVIDFNHPLYPLVNREPSKIYSKYTFFETIMVHAAMNGNFYGRIMFDRRTALPSSFQVFEPGTIEVFKVTDDRNGSVNRLFYRYTDPLTAKVTDYSSDQVLHVQGMSWNGLNGLNPIIYLANAVGTALAVEQYGSKFYKNGAHLNKVLKHPGKLSTDQYNRIRESWGARYAGTENAGQTAILEEGMDVESMSLNPVEAAFIESKKITVADIARMFGVPQHLLEDLDRATFNNIEHLSRMFATHTIRPWCQRIQAELDRKLFRGSSSGRFVTEFDLTSLLVGDMEAQAEYIMKVVQNGVMSINDARRLLGLNPVENGNTHFVPLNMQPLDMALQPEENEAG